jgi:hypothetical protein
MKGKFCLHRAVTVGIISTSILCANAQVACKKGRGSWECQVGSERLTVLDSADTLPIKLQSGDEYILSTGSNDKDTECFRESDSRVIECIVNDGDSPRWHIVWKMGGSRNDRPITEVISYLKRETGSSKNTSMYAGLSVEIKENNSQSSTGLSSLNSGAEPSVSGRQINVTPPPPLPTSQAGEADGEESDISTGSGMQEPSAQSPASTMPSKSLLEMIPEKNRLKGDIDGDGMNETVAWKKFKTTDLGDFYQLFVFDDDRRLLWKGPAVADKENRYVFWNWDFGESLPEALLDVDGDNQAELLAPSPQSDVSPVFYRILAWNGRRFVERRPGVLMRSTRDPSRFIWVNPYPGEGDRGAWVSRIIPQNSIHRARAEVTEANRGGYRMGEALIRFMPWGARILEWKKRLAVVSDDQDSSGDKSQSYSYIARLSSRDHYNSRGHRLRRMIDILHQDRANYYKGGGDSEDTGDGLFGTLEARREMDQMYIVPEGVDLQKLRRAVIGGTPLLRIEPDFSQNSLRVFLLQP